ncbi:MAG: hypothetical protein ABSA52_02550 [Candidatus Binatia bacterium]|jgi:hypothetical protein
MSQDTRHHSRVLNQDVVQAIAALGMKALDKEKDALPDDKDAYLENWTKATGFFLRRIRDQEPRFG